MKKLLLISIVILGFSNAFYAQCAYPAGATQVGAVNTLCIDSPTAYTTATVNAGQFALVNVVQGFVYTFSVGDVFAAAGNANRERLNLYNATGNVGLTTARGQSGTSITWTATFSGQVKVLLTRDDCIADNTAGGSLTFAINTVNNTLDDQTVAFTNSWLGHVYNYNTGDTPLDPTSGAYVGNYGEPEIFARNFGGNDVCFNVFSNIVLRTNIYTNGFAVKYRMRSTRPAGCYNITIRGDDGVRLSVDGTNVFDRWLPQAPQTYTNLLVYLDGDANLILDYFEGNGQNIVEFGITSFNPSSNTISPVNTTVCSNNTITIDGSAYPYNPTSGNPNGTITNPTLKFQWQVSADNSTFTNITGATLEDYTPPAITTTTTQIRYYRRVLSAVAAAAAACEWNSNVATVVTTPNTNISTSTPITNTATNVSCTSFRANWTSIPTASNYLLTVATNNTFTAIVPGYNALSVGPVNNYLVTGLSLSTPYFYRITAFNGCSNTTSNVSNITTLTTSSLPNNVSNGFEGGTFCAGSQATLTFNANDGSGFPYVLSYTDGTTTYIHTTTAAEADGDSTWNVPVTSNTTYTLLSITNANGCVRTTGFAKTNASVIFRPNPTATISGTASVCLNDTSPNVTFSNPQTVAITVTYTINGGTNQTVNIPASSSANVAAPTTVAGTFVYNLVSVVYTSNPNCTQTLSGSATITVNRSPAGLSYSVPNPIYCVGTPITANNATLTTAGLPAATFVISPSLPTGLNLNNSTGQITGTPTTASAATNYLITASNTCGSANTSLSITVSIPPPAPTVTTITHAFCESSTGSVLLGNLPAGSWTLNQTGFDTNTINGSGATYTVTGLAPGTYNFTVNNGSCTSNALTGVTINAPITNTWNGTTWSSGVPTINQAVVIGGNYTLNATDGNINSCSLIVNTGFTVTVPPGFQLLIRNNLTLNGTITIADGGSLVQINDAATNSGSGALNYTRTTNPMRRYDFTYWSSPVVGYTLGSLSPNTLSDKYYSFNGATGSWVFENTATVMAPAVGYVIRAPQTFNINTPAPYTAIFSGMPNNGLHQIPVVPTKYYIVGNPYPSAMDADSFLEDPINTNLLVGSIYFWTHNTLPSATAYSSDDYAVYNLTGGAGTIAAPNTGINNNVPDGTIGTGNAFVIGTTAAGNVQFNNSMRLQNGSGAALGNSQFFKGINTAKKGNVVATEKSRVWMDFSNSQGAYKQALVGYLANASNDYEGKYDAYTFNANKYVDFYSLQGTNKLAIQGRALPFDNKDQVPLGYKTTIAGKFTIAINKTDGLLKETPIYLEDKEKAILHDLRKASYDFETVVGTFDNRFVLRYYDENAVVLQPKPTPTPLADKRIAWVENGKVRITSGDKKMVGVQVFDVTGKQLLEIKDITAHDYTIENLRANKQLLLIKIILEDTTEESKKIVF